MRLICRVFKSGPVVNLVQDPGHGFCQGYRVLIGSLDHSNQNDIVLIKKQLRIQWAMGCNWVLPGQPGF